MSIPGRHPERASRSEGRVPASDAGRHSPGAIVANRIRVVDTKQLMLGEPENAVVEGRYLTW